MTRRERIVVLLDNYVDVEAGAAMARAIWTARIHPPTRLGLDRSSLEE